jgi:hypothetical protein
MARRAKPAGSRATKPKRARVRGGAAAPANVVRALADRRAIEDGLICYARALDARDYARLRDCLAPGVRVKYGGASWLSGVAEVASFCARILAPLDASQHRLGTIDVDLDGDRAMSTTYLCAEHLRGGRRYTVGGSYLDVWTRTSAGWRIAQRELVTTWTDGDPSVLGGRDRP